MSTPIETKCHCGSPLHYTDPAAALVTEALIRLAGSDFVRVTCGGRTWLVQRHYIALHGLKALELPFLGFEEVTGE
jgi:hypothetical protein